MSGLTGRYPLGPRRNSIVIPAPTSAPSSAAVRRSYSSRETSSSLARADARRRAVEFPGRGVVVVEFVVRAVVPIEFLLERLVIDHVRLGQRMAIERLPAESCCPLAYAPHRRCGRHECVLRLLLHHLNQRVELVESLLRERDRMVQALIGGGDRLIHLLHID